MSPREALQGILLFGVIGLAMVFGGSVITSGGLYNDGNANPSAAHPLIGTVIFFGGVAMIAVGLLLATIDITNYRRTKNRNRP